MRDFLMGGNREAKPAEQSPPFKNDGKDPAAEKLSDQLVEYR